ncbi:DM13 domain-containing protein [Aeromonas sanarellii]|uniref:DM13 domain-containing protein n=1 Tax=Aeromonas sanarellii TaxID=633415 RepID=A0ABS4BAC2_9GAMM|nr:DM13 domain-containing protein [Aeromonas sanarellii]MBP0604456.1 DM13 domain-containing protein [Aeromonas sanarellii]
MQRKTLALLLASHLLMGAAGFAAGIYLLPILIAPPAPSGEQVAARQAQATYQGTFKRERQDSDRLHWGEGKVSIGPDAISLMGRLAPGPDYQLYLSPAFVKTEADFAHLKDRMVHVGPVKTFDNFIVPLPAGIDPARYDTVIVWCETFGQFITSARYRE